LLTNRQVIGKHLTQRKVATQVSSHDADTFNMTKENRLILDMPDYGCVVWFEGEKNAYGLMCCEGNEFYRAGGVDEADEQLLTCDLTAPENQEFLDRINEAFGTNLRFDDFAGR
jgi:hypothetical protein